MTRHRTFRLTGGTSRPAAAGEPFRSAISMILEWQIGIAVMWLLFVGTLLMVGATILALWLPLSYALFDLYLFAREGLSRLFGRSSYARCSRAARGFLRLSPILMVATTLPLGAAGTALHEALGL